MKATEVTIQDMSLGPVRGWNSQYHVTYYVCRYSHVKKYVAKLHGSGYEFKIANLYMDDANHYNSLTCMASSNRSSTQECCIIHIRDKKVKSTCTGTC